MPIDELRKEFPFFASHPEVTYLDNAATTQKPRTVIDAVQRALLASANPGRGSHGLATAAEATIEQSRVDVARLIDARPEEIIFTSGATASLNLVAQGLSLAPTDEVIAVATDHKASVEPWLRRFDHSDCALPRRITGKVHRPGGEQTRVVCIRHDPYGVITPEAVRAVVTANTRVVALTQVHNVFGAVTDIAAIRAALPPHVLLSVDAAQSVGHIPVDVRALGADFVSFSGHKMFAAPGSGVLWARDQSLLQPRTFGGGSHPFEPGTPNVAAIASLGAAARFVVDIGIDNIAAHTNQLTRELIDALSRTASVEFLPGVLGGNNAGLVSFRVEGARLDDAAALLDATNIAARVGSHCSADPDGDVDSIRFSLHAYNTSAEVQRAAAVISQLAT